MWRRSGRGGSFSPAVSTTPSSRKTRTTPSGASASASSRTDSADASAARRSRSRADAIAAAATSCGDGSEQKPSSESASSAVSKDASEAWRLPAAASPSAQGEGGVGGWGRLGVVREGAALLRVQAHGVAHGVRVQADEEGHRRVEHAEERRREDGDVHVGPAQGV